MNKKGKKDFKGWMRIKAEIHKKGSLRTFREGEIWWCKVGENVGSEICGKGKDFLRPVLVVNKLSRYNFIGVPLTSKEHTGSWYVHFKFKGKDEYAVVAQVENISTHRLHYKMGEVPESDLNRVLVGLCGLFKLKISPNRKIRTGGYPRKSGFIIAKMVEIVKRKIYGRSNNYGAFFYVNLVGNVV